MKNKILRSIAAILVFMFTAPAFADSTLHIWECNLNDGKTQANAMTVSTAWLAAAKTMKGGADLQLTLEFPLASSSSGDGSFNFVLIATNPAAWGVFMNGYDDSAAAEADVAWSEVASCSGSSIWASVDVE